jgi:hypothetical protein
MNGSKESMVVLKLMVSGELIKEDLDSTRRAFLTIDLVSLSIF